MGRSLMFLSVVALLFTIFVRVELREVVDVRDYRVDTLDTSGVETRGVNKDLESW